MAHNVREYSAKPGDHLNTTAIQAAIDAAADTGGTVVIPPGDWLCGTIWMRSGVHLHLEMGARLLGTNNPDDYPRYSPIEEGIVVSRRVGPRRFIGAIDCDDIVISGPGTIDGQGGCAGRLNTAGDGAEGHPQNIQLVKCRNATIRDLTLRNAGSWMQQIKDCRGVRLTGLRIWNHGNKTNDGTDIDGSRDVIVSDLDIDSHDDAIVFKSTGPSPCRNILVTNCRLRSNCHGIKFGTESVGGFQDIQISNCAVSPSQEPAPLPDHPEGRPVITGCALECTDGGHMARISIHGLHVDRAFAPIFVKLGNRLDRRIKEDNPPAHGIVEDISISHVVARQSGPISCSLSGYPGHPLRRIRLTDIDLELVGGITPDKVLDDVPENSAIYPEVNMYGKKHGGRQLPTWGFFLRHIEDLTLRDIRLRLLNDDCRQPILMDDVTGLYVDHVLANEKSVLLTT